MVRITDVPSLITHSIVLTWPSAGVRQDKSVRPMRTNPGRKAIFTYYIRVFSAHPLSFFRDWEYLVSYGQLDKITSEVP